MYQQGKNCKVYDGAILFDQVGRNFGVTIEALHPDEVLFAVVCRGKPRLVVSLFIVGCGLRVVGFHGRHFRLTEESADVQVADLLEESAHLFVRVFEGEAATRIHRELDIARRVNASAVEGGAQDQPPV